jgi:hypothetical protein
MNGKKAQYKLTAFATVICCILTFAGCNSKNSTNEKVIIMKERQISHSAKNHGLDNNDNFSPDGKFLCYDTRGTVYNENLANCKSIEKIEIETGKETVLWEPEYVTGEEAAPGVAAVSWHPSEDKVIFIHGPLLEEVEKRGYYGIRNRTGVEVSADGLGTIIKVDKRDVETNRPTTLGAQRGGTHRHEYTRNGNRIGFTYDDYINENHDRTIGYMEPNPLAPEGFTHYFAVLLKPAEKGKSKPGEIEKAYGDSWVDSEGSMRAFVGNVRAENGVDYDVSLFVADIPDQADITSAGAGNGMEYPTPPKGIQIRRLTHSGNVGGIVRGSFDGKQIAYLTENTVGIMQIAVIASDGSDLSENKSKQPVVLSNFNSDASKVRWHPSNEWIFSLVDGNVVVTNIKQKKSIQLTNDDQVRDELVVSPDGNTLAYTIVTPIKISGKEFRQIFVMNMDWNKIKQL